MTAGVLKVEAPSDCWGH